MQIGFMVIDALAKSEGVDMRKLEKSAAVGKMKLQGKQIILAKPVTFMNNSGESVAALAKYYKVSGQAHLWVVGCIKSYVDQFNVYVWARWQ
jgi:PTH1 family peptidyl-tRNA hydrolase